MRAFVGILTVALTLGMAWPVAAQSAADSPSLLQPVPPGLPRPLPIDRFLATPADPLPAIETYPPPPDKLAPLTLSAPPSAAPRSVVEAVPSTEWRRVAMPTPQMNVPSAVVGPSTVPNFSAEPAYAYRPVVPVVSMPQNLYVGRGIIGQPTVYVPGQPVRNFLRFLSP